MRSGERTLALVAAMAVTLGCGGHGGGGGGGGIVLPNTARNVLPVSVDGTLCGGNQPYVNEPCVSVTVCTPGTTTCQTINDVLLDTGSFGLRIFKQVLTVSPTPVPAGTGVLAECIHYGDGTSDWGPVQIADVVLGGEPAVRVPIQVIDATFPGLPSGCSSPESGPTAAGFNGILGVGAYAEDCGGTCVTGATNGLYWSCSGTSCSGATVPLGQQVSNPVALLPQDNNGVIVKLPAVAVGGTTSVEGGQVLLGIGTALDNAPGAVSVLGLDASGEFRTSFAGSPYVSVADTGSNGLFFSTQSVASLTPCTSSASWYCPSSALSLTATNSGASGGGSAAAAFQIANYFDQPTPSSYGVLPGLGGPGLSGSTVSPALFDWGMPFFLGRTVYVGIEGRASSLGTGPYVAY